MITLIALSNGQTVTYTRQREFTIAFNFKPYPPYFDVALPTIPIVLDQG